MPKIKSRRAVVKRYKKTGTGKYLRKKSCKSHLLTKKSSARKRNLSRPECLSKGESAKLLIMMPY
jgi:large subunit ribosomal protein L35